jgi:DNA-binding transcriptional MerR regulator
MNGKILRKGGSHRLKISQLSKTTGVSARSIRHYDKKKLLAARRLDNDYREFDESAVERIRAIQTFLRFGLTTNEIEQVLSCRDSRVETDGWCEEMLAIYENKLEKVSGQIQALSMLQQRLEKQIRIMKKRHDRHAAKP